ncbi:glycoside hydrolase family 95 protein [Sphingobacterium litopenaei]|uniref:Glycoside hydrolase family 95 protein n=1 Tax=Sphingobacterium litopenaei TaxID=2763500 RepID=A0ABR7YE72_9SPHI|nr:glycoside hydrolase family 95 protein [Sphingobacterium litopenaei]MBD1429575.1 glycoside hydrolase family 95 protein [Sphingobacterium litopenaei]
MKNILTILMCVCCLTSYAQDLKLWYDKPAKIWEETLPLGNGWIGMMPNGGVQEENIVLNEISMWSGSPQDPNNYNAYKKVSSIQELLFQGKNDEAEKLVNQNFVCVGAGSGHGNGAKVPYGCFQNLGYLNIHFLNNATYTQYRRELDLETGIASSHYSNQDTSYFREYFVSQDKNIGAMRFSSNKKFAIDIALHFYRDENVKTHTVKGNTILVEGNLPNGYGGEGLRYATKFLVVNKDGKITNYDNQIIVKGAQEIVIYYTASTDYYEHHPTQYVENQLSEKLDYATLKKQHLRKYKEVFDRVKLNIENDTVQSHLPTDKRLANFFQNPAKDNNLAVLYYQFGRYLTISSTARDSDKALPPNLQGLWAHQIQTPWNGDYHLNVNAQMNHWGVEVNNLSEYHKPFINLIKRVAKEGEKTAKAYYNAPGWVVYMMTNVWGYSAPGEHASWGASTASGWLCNHLWEHYLFTKDKAYLNEVYPILKDAALFYKNTLVQDPKTKYWVTSPSVSPENGFRLPNGKVASVVMGPTIDNQIVRELYISVISADSILQKKDQFASALKNDLNLLPPAVVVSKDGRVMEWLEDYEEIEPQHRHVSHLYGLYPAPFISPITTPEWASAARRTLEVRGDGGTGWSRAWKILFWARLHDGDHALEILRQLLKPAINDQGKISAGTYPNLFCAHPPFQIDGNFGGSAGIAEMLVQSHEGFIHLLPALPAAWKKGEVKGLRVRGNMTVDIRWEDNTIIKYAVKGPKGQKIQVRVNGVNENKIL